MASQLKAAATGTDVSGIKAQMKNLLQRGNAELCLHSCNKFFPDYSLLFFLDYSPLFFP